MFNGARPASLPPTTPSSTRESVKLEAVELESVELMLKRNSSSRLMPGPHAAKAGTLTHVWEPQHHPADGWLNLP